MSSSRNTSSSPVNDQQQGRSGAPPRTANANHSSPTNQMRPATRSSTLPRLMNLVPDIQNKPQGRLKTTLYVLATCTFLSSLGFLNSQRGMTRQLNDSYTGEVGSSWNPFKALEEWFFVISEDELERIQGVKNYVDYNKTSIQQQSLERMADELWNQEEVQEEKNGVGSLRGQAAASEFDRI